MHSPTSASASAQFFPTSKVSHAQNSRCRSRISAAARSSRPTRSLTAVRDHAGNAASAACTACSAISTVASGCVPITCAGRAGFVEEKLCADPTRWPPIIRPYFRPSSPPTRSSASIMLRFVAASLKSVKGSFLKGESISLIVGSPASPWLRRKFLGGFRHLRGPVQLVPAEGLAIDRALHRADQQPRIALARRMFSLQHERQRGRCEIDQQKRSEEGQ